MKNFPIKVIKVRVLYYTCPHHIPYVARFGGQARAIYRTTPPLQQASTVSYLENQLAVCSTLKSAPEYKFWLSTYIRFLAQEGKY